MAHGDLRRNVLLLVLLATVVLVAIGYAQGSGPSPPSSSEAPQIGKIQLGEQWKCRLRIWPYVVASIGRRQPTLPAPIYYPIACHETEQRPLSATPRETVVNRTYNEHPEEDISKRAKRRLVGGWGYHWRTGR